MWSAVVAFLVVTCLLASVVKVSVSAETPSSEDVSVNINVYIVAIEGVNDNLTGNMSWAVQGAVEASSVDSVKFALGDYPGDDSVSGKRIPANITASVITDWQNYRVVVENVSNAIIVNVHGETFPVPSNYTKEQWMQQVCEAVAYRNNTWVHTGGYPFYYYQTERGETGEWGQDGFKQFCAFIGKENVTCGLPSYIIGNYRWHLSQEAMVQLAGNWNGAWALYAYGRSALNSSEWDDCLLYPIWGDGSPHDYPLGAIVRYGTPERSGDYGLYVHVGAIDTSNIGIFFDVRDWNFTRSYIGTAEAIYMVSMRLVAESLVSKALRAVGGDVKSEAGQLSQQAVEAYGMAHFDLALLNAEKALEKMAIARNQFVQDIYVLSVAALVSAGAVLAALAVGRRRKLMRRTKERKD